jgi:large subunit ribosomal protein L4
MELSLKDATGALEVSEATFGREFNEAQRPPRSKK